VLGDIRHHIKDARLKRGWGRRELGAAVALPQSHISLIESGKIAPRCSILLDIVRVLDLDLLLVPRSLVPTLQWLIRAQEEPESIEELLDAGAKKKSPGHSRTTAMNFDPQRLERAHRQSALRQRARHSKTCGATRLPTF
jgi:transcriptional regulator with XRE-family HTH domain